MNQTSLGWNARFESEYQQNSSDLKPCRVIAIDKGSCLVAPRDAPTTSTRATIAGRLRHHGSSELAVGDWVGVQDGRIDYVFQRYSAFVRKRVGGSEEQPIAANVDWTLAAVSLNDDFSPARVERFVLAAWDAGTTPIVLATKVDQCAGSTVDVESALASLADVALGCEIIATSVVTGEGIELLRSRIGEGTTRNGTTGEATTYGGKTAVLVGSSGVGKSSLVNALLGREAQDTGTIRTTDSKGRHTTTRRELLALPGGGFIIDTPGIREFGLLSSDDGPGGGLETGFRDIEELTQNCGFRDCSHQTEPRCAVLEAIEDGALDAERLRRYFKLERERAYNERSRDVHKQRQAGRAFQAHIRQHLAKHPKRR